jgi:hypothetical protein
MLSALPSNGSYLHSHCLTTGPYATLLFKQMEQTKHGLVDEDEDDDDDDDCIFHDILKCSWMYCNLIN